jgi:SAM-dependent methyltransferase
MQYEPIKESIGRFFARSVSMRKFLYILLDLLLLRAWHIKKELRSIALRYNQESAVLDAGSGFGQYTWFMSKLNPLWIIKAVDLNKDQTEDCKIFFEKNSLSDRVIFETCDLRDLSERERYNIILCVDVMEHIEEDILVFKNFYNALNDDGVLLISTPSDQGGSDVHNASGKSFIDEHVRDGYGIIDITTKLNLAGFRDVNAKYTYGKPGNISWRLSMKYPVKMLNISYLFFIILPFYYLIFFPISVILNFLDLYMTHKRGTGLIVTARK